MLLDGRTAIVFGAGGAVGGAVARAFAREGAKVFLSGRNLDPVEAVAGAIRAAGGQAEAATVDVLDEAAVEHHVAEVVDKAGRVNVMLNAVGFRPAQGVPLGDLSLADFAYPVATWTNAQFLSARAVARHMVRRRSGVIIMLSAAPARQAISTVGGFGVACAAVEELTWALAADLGPQGVRVACLKPQRIGETVPAAGLTLPRDQFIGLLEGKALSGRLPTLAEVADAAVCLASDYAAAMTGAVINLSGAASG